MSADPFDSDDQDQQSQSLLQPSGVSSAPLCLSESNSSSSNSSSSDSEENDQIKMPTKMGYHIGVYKLKNSGFYFAGSVSNPADWKLGNLFERLKMLLPKVNPVSVADEEDVKIKYETARLELEKKKVTLHPQVRPIKFPTSQIQRPKEAPRGFNGLVGN